jgi:1-acyl-sn-glycerol-3-phosphate acyltransferase
MTQHEPKVIYYAKVTDDFAGTNIQTQKVDSAFPFVRKSLIWKAASFLLYYIVALPLVTFYIRVVNRTKVVNKTSLRRMKGGCFIYGNHTHWSDAFLPHVIAAPKRTYVIAGPDAVSIKGIRNIVTMLGAIPVPTQPRALHPFIVAIRQRSREKACITIYPEAHIWPYYTGIRPFSAASFTYPAEMGTPVIAMVTRYRERKSISGKTKAPARTIILSDPIQAAPGLSVREAQKDLHRRVSKFMIECANLPGNFEYVRYCQRGGDGQRSEASADAPLMPSASPEKSGGRFAHAFSSVR